MPRAQHPTSDLPSLSFRPRHDRVVVKQLPLPPPDPDKLLIPDSMKKPPLEGIVRALGTHTPGLNIGDHILYAEFSGAPIVIDGEEFFVLRDEEVLGIRD